MRWLVPWPCLSFQLPVSFQSCSLSEGNECPPSLCMILHLYSYCQIIMWWISLHICSRFHKIDYEMPVLHEIQLGFLPSALKVYLTVHTCTGISAVYCLKHTHIQLGLPITIPTLISLNANIILVGAKEVLLKYEGRLIISWTDGSSPLLYRGRRRLLCQVVVVGVKK
jgi:hypothetical protein